MRNKNAARQAAIMAVFCLGAAFFQLILSLQMGGISPQVILFSVLGAIFAALWYTLRKPL